MYDIHNHSAYAGLSVATQRKGNSRTHACTLCMLVIFIFLRVIGRVNVKISWGLSVGEVRGRLKLLSHVPALSVH